MPASAPIYMDNHATTRVDPRVVEAMLPYFAEAYGNAGSVGHAFGDAAREAVERSRATIAATCVSSWCVGSMVQHKNECRNPPLSPRSLTGG